MQQKRALTTVNGGIGEIGITMMTTIVTVLMIAITATGIAIARDTAQVVIGSRQDGSNDSMTILAAVMRG